MRVFLPCLIVWFLLVRQEASAQEETMARWYGVSLGMGASIFSAPSVVDYVNIVAQPSIDQRLEEFSSSVEFFLTPEVQVAEAWSVGFDYNYMIKSYSLHGGGSVSDFTYSVHLPSIVVHYLVPAEGYGFKVGGGVGYALGTFSEALYGSLQALEYQSRGGTLKLEVIGNTKFDQTFWGAIALDLRWVLGGTFRSGERELRVGETAASLSFFSAGLKLGVAFQW